MNEGELSKNTVKNQSCRTSTKDKICLTFQPSLEMSKNFLIYGANGYTGELIAREAVKRGMKPILAGRSLAKVEPLAKELCLTARSFSLKDKKSLEYTLKEVDFVLHCAGPFSLTSRPMVEACLRLKKHYLDVTGEIAVFEQMARLDEKAKTAGIMIMPGVGFDVVPSDCLAAHLKNRLPSATNLTLAFYGLGKISHGTQATMTMNAGNGGAIRRKCLIPKAEILHQLAARLPTPCLESLLVFLS